MELKHLAPYLPYNLYVQGNNTKDLYLVQSMREGAYYFKGYRYWADDFDYKPVLRPLTDLQDKDKDYWIEFCESVGLMNADNLIHSIVNKTFYAIQVHTAFLVYEVLFKMHFDVFGLIEEGLAININTIDHDSSNNTKR